MKTIANAQNMTELLDLAYDAVKDGDAEESAGYLAAYQTSRTNGGPQPEFGDIRYEEIKCLILEQTTRERLEPIGYRTEGERLRAAT